MQDFKLLTLVISMNNNGQTKCTLTIQESYEMILSQMSDRLVDLTTKSNASDIVSGREKLHKNREAKSRSR